MEVQSRHIYFDNYKGYGPRELSDEEDRDNREFSINVTQATAILTGFDVAFSRSDSPRGRPMGNLVVSLEAKVSSRNNHYVDVKATFGLRDNSGDWDDEYVGTIFYTVVAE